MSKNTVQTTNTCGLSPYNDPHADQILDDSSNDSALNNNNNNNNNKESFFNYQPKPLYNYKTSGHVYPRGLGYWRGKIQPYWRHRWSKGVYPFKPYYHYPMNEHGYVYTHFWPYYYPSPYSYRTPVYEDGKVKYVESFGNLNLGKCNMNYILLGSLLVGIVIMTKNL